MKSLILLVVLAAAAGTCAAWADSAAPAGAPVRMQDPFDGVVIHGSPPQGMMHQAPSELTGTPIRPGQKMAPARPAPEKPDRPLGMG